MHTRIQLDNRVSEHDLGLCTAGSVNYNSYKHNHTKQNETKDKLLHDIARCLTYFIQYSCPRAPAVSMVK